MEQEAAHVPVAMIVEDDQEQRHLISCAAGGLISRSLTWTARSRP